MTDAIPHTLDEAVSRYLASLPSSASGARMTELRRFVSWYGSDTPLSELQPFRIGAYSEGLDASTMDVNRKIEPVKDFFKYAKKMGWTDSNLAVHLKVRGARRKDKSAVVGRENQRIPITAEGYEQLKAELDELIATRPQMADAIRHAAADKDFRENAPYHEARNHKARIESRIKELEATLAVAQIIDSNTETADRAKMGMTVVLQDLNYREEVRFTLVSSTEVDLKQGKISVESPTGRALLDRRKGEHVEVQAPSGVIRYRILDVATP